MTEGDVVLTSVSQVDGVTKNRPAIFLREMPLFDDLLVCGVSTQLRQEVSGFDDLILPEHDDFNQSGLLAASLIRLGFLAVIPRKSIPGSIGAISRERRRRLLERLSNHLLA